MQRFLLLTACFCLTAGIARSDEPPAVIDVLRVAEGKYSPITEPPCSYCATQHLKGMIRGDDRVLAWLRAVHNGGAVSLRHFLSASRVINDTYGLFFYDPDGGYVAAYKKDYGYHMHGWRRGVMVVEGEDGTLWSALTGRAFAGPKNGQRLERIPAMLTTWSHWMMLHPESTAYDLFDGQKYNVTELPTGQSEESRQSMGDVDARLKPLANVLGVEFASQQKAYALDYLKSRDCIVDTVAEERVAVFWYEPTKTAVAYRCRVNGQDLTFEANEIAPPTAPFVDRETGTRWTLAGRAVDGPLKGTELTWMPSIQCRWYAWAAEYPETLVAAPATVSSLESGEAIRLQAALIAPEDATDQRLAELQDTGANAIVIALDATTDDGRNIENAAARRVRDAELDLYYWIEVARSEELADAHPDWMASLQGHPEWRRLFPNAPMPGSDEVVKTYPWVPILSEEGFQGQLARVEALLHDRPSPTGVFLNDLQGSPSACGCGNTLCRWTTDYGPARTTKPSQADAAAKFVAHVQEMLPSSQVIPVWVTECEEHDGAHDGHCAGVGCFKGICWKAYTEQLMPVAEQSNSIGVLAPFRAFQRELPVYGPPGSWLTHALETFQTMPPQRGGEAIASSRLIAVLQGWDVTLEELARQVDLADASGAGGYVVSYEPIEQGWQPRVVRYK